MAVHTELNPSEIEEFCAPYDLGGVRGVEGVPAGSIHTTYRVNAGAGVFYLRLAEGLGREAVAWELGFLDHLCRRDVPAVRVVHPRRGGVPGTLRGRPAALFHEVPGRGLGRDEIDADVCAGIGEVMGRMHRAAADFEPTRPNRFGPEAVAGWIRDLPRDDVEVAAVRDELEAAVEASRGFGEGLPAGAIHADLFPDNVHFEGGRLAGILDFEMACTAPWILDLAIALLVWTWEEGFRPARVEALLAAYREVRDPSPAEWEGLRSACRFAAVRYAVTRIRDFHLASLPGDRLVRKDWRRFLRRLRDLEALRLPV